MFFCMFISVGDYVYICSEFIGDSHLVASVMSSSVKTEVGPHTVQSSQPCRLNGLPPRNSTSVKNGFADNDSQSVRAVGHSTSATALPAGDLLLVPRHSRHSVDRWAVMSVIIATYSCCCTDDQGLKNHDFLKIKKNQIF